MSKALKWLDYCGYADLVTFLHLGAICPGVVWLGGCGTGGGAGRRGRVEDPAEGEVNDLNLHETEQKRKEHYN